MKRIFPEKIQVGDEIRVLSPSTSLKVVNSDADNRSTENYITELGYNISYSKNINEKDILNSSSIQSRVDDIHDAFKDEKVKVILTSIGGFNSNELLPYLDYELIKANPKILCGYSDITSLHNGIFAKTGLVTYSGPAYSSFKMKELQDYQTNRWLIALREKSYDLNPSDYWSSDPWFIPEEPRNLIKNKWKVYNHGHSEGITLVGNMNTFILVQGTEYMPQVDEPILFIEIAEENNAFDFARNLASLLQVYKHPKAIIIGRFPKESNTTEETLTYILDKHPILKTIPVIYNVNFGHTQPIFTFPIGGTVKVDTQNKSLKVVEG